MENIGHKHKGLILFQKSVWLGSVIYFSTVSLLLFLKVEIAATLSYWGVVLVLSAIVCQLFVIATDFKRAGKTKFVYLSYVLLFVIVTMATLGAILL